MVGRDRVAEDAERFCADDFGDVARCWRKAVEERWLLDVGRVAIPLVDIAGGGFDFVPLWILVGEAGVEALEHIRFER